MTQAQKTIFGTETEVKDPHDPKMEASEIVRALAKAFDLPVYHDRTWTVTFGDGSFVVYTGNAMGIDSKPGVVSPPDHIMLEALAMEAVPELIGQALMNQRAISLVNLNPLRICMFGIMGESPRVEIEYRDGKFYKA